MRLLLTLAAVASLAACSHNTNDNTTTGQAAPETGRASPADTSHAVTPPATGTVDTSTNRMKPDTTKGAFDTTKTTPPATPVKHDSM